MSRIINNYRKKCYHPYQLEISKKNNSKVGGCAKLVPHLMDKIRYCIHYRNLKFVKDLGMIITKVHNIVSFNQKPFLKQYIDFNTAKRKQSKNDFEKDFFKLMNNAVFGKTMENVRNRICLHLTTNPDNAIKWFSKLNFKTCKKNDNLHFNRNV